MKELTYVMIKPDGVKKQIQTDVLKTFRDNGLEINIMQTDTLSNDLDKIKEHYSHLLDKPFYPELEAHMSSGPIVKMVVAGEDAIKKVRTLVGPTRVKDAIETAPNSIRAKYGNPNNDCENAIHASDALLTAIKEIYRFYDEDLIEEVLYKYKDDMDAHQREYAQIKKKYKNS